MTTSTTTPRSTIGTALRLYDRGKIQQPDTLLMFRMGDNYEMYYEDADVASSVIGTPVVNQHPSNVPTVAFPAATIEKQLRSLIMAGHRVAMCKTQ